MANNFIRPIESPNLAYQGNMAARRRAMDQDVATNAFALNQAQQMAPYTQQGQILDVQQQYATLQGDRQKQAIDKLTRLRNGIYSYAQQPLTLQQEQWPILAKALEANGVDDVPSTYDSQWMQSQIIEADAFTGGPEKPDWQKKYEWQLANPGKAAALSSIGAIGGKGTQIYNAAPYAKKEFEGIGSAYGGIFKKIIEAGYAAEESLAVLEQMRSIPLKTGAMEPLKVALARVMHGLGMDRWSSAIANVEGAESFESLTTQLVNTALREHTGPQTDDDARRMRKTISNLKDHPLAREFKENSMKALLLRKIQMANFIQEKIENSDPENPISYSKARQAWNRYKLSTPTFASHIRGKNGLPIFYWQFVESWQSDNPEISIAEIEQKWRNISRGKRTP